MGINVGNLSASLTLQSAQFMTQMKAVAAQSQATSKAINSAMNFAKGAVVGLAGAFSVDMFSRVIKGAFDYADAIQDLSDRTGASTKFIQSFGYAAQISGSSVESARAGIEKFSKNLGEAAAGNKEMRETLLGLGVSLKTIASGDTDTAIKNVADGISKIDNKAAQAAETAKLFGKANQNLTATISGGSAALSDFAKKAAQLGIVMDSDLIANAGKVNDKLDTMQMILSAQTASMIVKNADAIVSLADGVTSLVGSLAKFWSQNPQTAMTLMGAMAGGAVGGLPGAAVGGVAGYIGGTKMKQSMSDSNMDVGYRKQQLIDAKNAYKEAKSSAPGIAGSAAEALNKQWALFQTAVKNSKLASTGSAPKTGNGYLAAIKEPKAKVNLSAEKATKAFDAAMLSEKLASFSLRGQLQTDPRLNANLRHDSIGLEYGRYGANGDWQRGSKQGEIDDQLATGTFGDPSSKIAKARAEELKKQLDVNGQLEHSLINRELDAKLSAEDLSVRQAQIANDNDILQGEQGQARTQAERRKIMLKLLDNQIEQERIEQEAVIASRDATEAQKKIAQARLDLLPTLKAQGQKSVMDQTMSPMASYLDQMPQTMGEISQSVEGVAVDAFGKLNDSIADAITGAGSLKAAFGDMANFVLSSLIKIAVQQAIIKPLAGALFGSGDSGGKGLFGSLLGGLFGKRANGGYTAAGMYKVGERGEELINVGQPSSVVTSRELRSMGANDNQRGAINVTVNGVNDPAMVKKLATEAIVQALPATTRMGTAATMQQASYPRMR